MVKLKILFLTHHWNENTHHARNSGYQQIVINASKEYECTVVTCGIRDEARMENNIMVHYVKPIISRDYFFTRRLAISKFAHKIEGDFDVVHALYSDCGFYQTHPNLISTFHISPFLSSHISLISSLFLRLKYFIIERRVFNRSKTIILMSNNLKKGIEQYISKTIFIPHGINTDYWNPNSFNDIVPSGNFVLSVGSNGVDKELLYSAIANNPKINFVVVGLKKFECNLHNLSQLSGISDEELKELYYKCLLFIRPMTFATANNSVLEALSMDKPVLISTDNGLYDYFDNSLPYIRIVKNEKFVSELSRIIEQLTEEIPTDTNTIREYAFRNFDWEVIYRQTKGLY
jgi:glycosyltransferase involved in cell wall biosynthesis